MEYVFATVHCGPFFVVSRNAVSSCRSLIHGNISPNSAMVKAPLKQAGSSVIWKLARNGVGGSVVRGPGGWSATRTMSAHKEGRSANRRQISRAAGRSECSKSQNDRFTCDTLVSYNRSENRVESPYPEKRVIGNRYSPMGRFVRVKDDVATRLVDFPVMPVPAEGRGQSLSRWVSRQLHATDRTSSLTR